MVISERDASVSGYKIIFGNGSGTKRVGVGVGNASEQEQANVGVSQTRGRTQERIPTQELSLELIGIWKVLHGLLAFFISSFQPQDVLVHVVPVPPTTRFKRTSAQVVWKSK